MPFGILPIFRGKLAVSFREATHCEPGLNTQRGLSCKPSVRAHDAKRDLALCVASDGLWDFVEEKAFGETPGTFRFRCFDFFFERTLFLGRFRGLKRRPGDGESFVFFWEHVMMTFGLWVVKLGAVVCFFLGMMRGSGKTQ